MIENFKICKTRDHLIEKGEPLTAENYVEIVGDPCYRYCRAAKETFLLNFECAFLFVKARPYLSEYAKKKLVQPNSLEVLEELMSIARKTLE